ncbi:hypothetical protein FRC07_013115 [Ceratobasidium sp. 392]|nr:hypothetical protein FRC07_013115 [Ceratobasidium sp. 392]
MSDDEIVIISSSPEPEDLGTVYHNKGKGRATNRTLVDLTLDNDVAVHTNLGNAPDEYEDVLDAPADYTHSVDGNSYPAAQQPQASGSGAQQDEVELPEDPVERAILQVLSVIPNVDPEHLRALVLAHESQSEEVDISTAIISQLLENPDYPKIEPLKRKGGGGDEEDGPNKRPKVDYLANGRVAPSDISYMNYAIDHLMRVDFPQIPKDYIKKVFFKNRTLYAPAYFALRSDLEAGGRFVVKKTMARSETSRGKRKALPENKDFDRERKWLLLFLEEELVKKAEEAELAECERDGTGVECGCCFGDFPFSWMVQCPDAHLFCRECARRSAEECIGNRKTNLVCMDQSGCKLAFAESEIQRFLPAKTFELWHRIKQEQDIELDHLPKSCKEVEQDKVLDARHAVEEAMNFVKDTGCNKMTCPKCRSLSCYVCRKVIKGYDHFDQTPPGAARRGGQSSKCPLWDSVDQRHADEVKKAAEAAQEEYRRLHPELEEEDLAVDLPAAPAPAPAPAPALMLPVQFGMPPPYPAHQLAPGFGFGQPLNHQALLQQAQQIAQQALAPQGRFFGGILDPQRAFQELQADQAAQRQRQAAFQREQERYQAAGRIRARIAVDPPPPAPAPVPAPRRHARRR